MDRYISVEKLKQFFRARNRDLFSVETICSILDVLPKEYCITVDEKEMTATVTGYKEITDRIQQEDNMNKVYFLDEKEYGGYHDYMVLNGRTGYLLSDITFQKGPRKDEKSVQGVLETDLLEIVRHRLRAFCEGGMKDPYTEYALDLVESALVFLERRTINRKRRGVLGTMEK